MMRAMTSLSMWKLSATRAMELVQLPTMSSTSMKLPVMPSMPRSFGPVPQEAQHKTLGNFILSLLSDFHSGSTSEIESLKWSELSIDKTREREVSLLDSPSSSPPILGQPDYNTDFNKTCKLLSRRCRM